MVEINWDSRVIRAEHRPPDSEILSETVVTGTTGGVRELKLIDGRTVYVCKERTCDLALPTPYTAASHRANEWPHRPHGKRRPYVDEVRPAALALPESAAVKPAGGGRQMDQETLFDLAGDDMATTAAEFIRDVVVSRGVNRRRMLELEEENERLRGKIDHLMRILGDFRTMADTALGGNTSD